MIKEAIEKLVRNISLSENEMEIAMNEIMSGNAADAQIASFITALRMKGETVNEITGAARVMRKKAVKVNTGGSAVVDTCGTGGDKKGTFNISTIAAFIAAGAGIKVAKHGNRSVSSQSGSADVLEALGVNINIESTKAEHLLNTVGICFLFAPLYHKAMKYAVGPRRQIGIRTIFNILGPLTNPAGASCQLIGVYDEELTGKIAHVLKNLGSVSASVVHGDDGTDEITITGKTTIAELRKGSIRSYIFDPEKYGYKIASQEQIRGGDANYNASLFRDILNGVRGPMRDIAELNSAFVIYTAGVTDNIKDAINVARDIIDSGVAMKKFEEFRTINNEDIK